MVSMNICSKKTFVILSLVVAVSSFLMYIPTLKSGFLWDDVQLITHPLNVSGNPYDIFLSGGDLYYRPLSHLSLAMDYGLWHLNPVHYHITNILLHIGNSLLVFVVGFLLLRNASLGVNGLTMNDERFHAPLLLSFFAALLFVLHPTHTESVAWISGRTDILGTLFFLLAFLSYLLYEKEGRAIALLLTSIFFLFSLFGKENALAFIFIILLYGVFAGMPKKKVFHSMAALAITIVVYFLFRKTGMMKMMMATPGSPMAFFSSDITFQSALYILSHGTGYYIEKLIFPFNLNLMPQIPAHPIYYFMPLIPFVLFGILYFSGHKKSAFLLAWLVVTLLPSLVILFSRIASPLGERYLYLPSVGFCIFVVAVLGRIRNRNTLFIVVLIILCSYSFSTHERLKVWKSELALWEDTVRKSPSSVSALTNYGRALIGKEELDKAKSPLLSALEIEKKSPQQTSIIYDLLGTAELKKNNYENAESYFNDSIRAEPKNSLTYNNLGALYLKMSESGIPEDDQKEFLGKAIKALKEALALSPNFLHPKLNLGLCYFKQGDFRTAEEYFYSVISSDPGSELSAQAMQFLVAVEFSKRKIPRTI